MAAPRGTGYGNAVCLVFGIPMDQKVLQDSSMAHLKDLLLDAAGFMASDLRS